MQLFQFTEEAFTTNIGGLTYLPDFISPADETALLNFIDNAPWRRDLKRRVQHYGYTYDYKARRIDHSAFLGPLPQPFRDLAERLSASGFFAETPDQTIVNEYLPGQGIAPHIDCEPCFGDAVASLSLGAPCAMEFSSPVSEEKHEMLLEPRSLLVITGQARYDWRHGIRPRKTDRFNGNIIQRGRRVSLTFRKVVAA